MTAVIAFIFKFSALAFNLLIAFIFISQKKGNDKLVRTLGSFLIGLVLPFGYVLARYLSSGSDIWVRISLTVVIAYLLTELLMDYILNVDFRSKWTTHLPYILLEYTTFFGLIYTAFTISDIWGWAVTITFWIAMACLIYLYAGRKGKKTGKRK